MQDFRHPDGSLTPLPAKNVDTGAGFERILAVLNGGTSLYASDTLTALVDEAQSVTGHRLGETDLGDIALRLMADHARTMTFPRFCRPGVPAAAMFPPFAVPARTIEIL